MDNGEKVNVRKSIGEKFFIFIFSRAKELLEEVGPHFSHRQLDSFRCFESDSWDGKYIHTLNKMATL